MAQGNYPASPHAAYIADFASEQEGPGYQWPNLAVNSIFHRLYAR